MTPKTSLLPPGSVPASMAREMAAEYVSVSPSHFDKLRKQGLIRSKRLMGKIVFLRVDLDAMLANLPYEDEE